MSNRQRVCAFLFASSFVFLPVNAEPLQGGVKSAAPLQGGVKSAEPLQGGVKSAAPLQGGVESTAPLQSSVHVLPGGANKTSYPLQGQAAQQYNGSSLQGGANSTTLQGGVAAPMYQSGTPAVQYMGGHAVNAIQPISTYTLTPHTGVMQFGPQVIVTPGGQSKGVMSFPGGSTYSHVNDQSITGGSEYGAQYSSSHGVTSASGYSVSRVPVTTGQLDPSGASFSMFTRYGESENHTMTYAPGYEPKAQSTDGKLTYNAPGTKVTIFGAHSGVVTYVPGYEVTVSTVGVNKETLGGVWSIPEIQPLHAAAGQLMAKKTFVQILAPEIQPLVAKAQLMPSLLKHDKVLDWKLWYERVAAAIYRRWKYSDVSAGTAKVRVTVTRNRDVSCQIVGFENAEDAHLDVKAQMEFREAALRAVNLVTTAEIPAFPANSTADVVRFDVDMSRRTTDAAGFDVATSEQNVSGKVLK
jgi:hypothetical protein